MKLLSAKPRKDGKYLVSLAFDTGKVVRSIVTREQAEKFRAESQDIKPHPTGFERRD